MKKYSIYILLSTALLSFYSCNEFLNEPYDNRLELKTIDDVAALTRNAYPTKHDLFTDVLTDSYYIFPSLMDAATKPVYTPIYLFKDDYEYKLNVPNPSLAYKHFYNKIYLANNAIEHLKIIQDGSQEQKNIVLAEALLTRAYCYFVLTNLFAMHYNTATYHTDLAVPLVLEVNRKSRPTFDRSTVKEVYALIESDMLEAIRLYESSPARVPTNPYQFTMAAAYAFACRLHLYKGDFEKTIEFADKTFAAKGLTLRDFNADRIQLTTRGWPFFSNQLNDPSTHPNIIMATQSGDFIHRPIANFTGGFYIDRGLLTKISALDRRRIFLNPAGTVIDNATWALKNNYAGEKTRYIMFGNEEVLLSRAEAQMKRTVPDRDAAIKDLEQFRRSRYFSYAPLPTTLTNEQLIAEILLQRQIEFLAEGLRWYDIKRLGLKVDHKLDINSNTIDAVLLPNDKRTALQIPVDARIGNPALEKQLNPR